MGKTSEDQMYTGSGKPIGKQQMYALLVDEDGVAILDEYDNEQLVCLQMFEGQLMVKGAVTTESVSNVVTVSFTRPDNITPYTALDVVGTSPATNMLFATGLPPGSKFAIISAKLEIDVGTIPTGMNGFIAHVYNAAPTAIEDNAPYNLPLADRAKYIDNIIINTPSDLGDTLISSNQNLLFTGKLEEGSSNVYVILQTPFGYTPTALTVKGLTLTFMVI